METKITNKRRGLITNRLFLIILAISILGNFIGVFFAYKFIYLKRQNKGLQFRLKESAQVMSALSDIYEEGRSCRLAFIHHSVGKGILEEGGLKDSLEQMNIAVKSITYGDSIGNFTDMCNWVPKFRNDMDLILRFKNHPNIYYSDGRTNDIILFKSCFPNSDIMAEGHSPGDPMSKDMTLENYKAVFTEIGKAISKHPRQLFIYLTFPPLVPPETTLENAARARKFNDWLVQEYLPTYHANYGLNNLVFFDLFGALSDSSNYLKSEYRRGNIHDSHPNLLGNQEVAKAFMSFFRPVFSDWISEKAEIQK